MESTERACPVCGSWEKKKLFHQYFSSDNCGYDVVVCECCGFTFADNIPTQVQFDRYYQKQTKYSGKPTLEQLEQFAGLADLISRFFMKPDIRILEIGCSNGGLLNELKRKGFNNLTGLDPNPECAQYAKSNYGLNVFTDTIATFDASEKFDLIILVAVLEHLVDLRGSLAKIRNLLTSRGQIFVEVPDADAYDYSKSAYAPFMEFSQEHINYFTSASLDHFMASHQFRRHFFCRNNYGDAEVLRVIYESSVIPLLGAEASLQHYIIDSANAEQVALFKIHQLQQNETPVVVWGIGTHTLRMWNFMRGMNILSFVLTDGYGDVFKGLPVISPKEIPEKTGLQPVSIFVSSREHQKTILDQIRELKLKNEVILPYG